MTGSIFTQTLVPSRQTYKLADAPRSDHVAVVAPGGWVDGNVAEKESDTVNSDKIARMRDM